MSMSKFITKSFFINPLKRPYQRPSVFAKGPVVKTTLASGSPPHTQFAPPSF